MKDKLIYTLLFVILCSCNSQVEQNLFLPEEEPANPAIIDTVENEWQSQSVHPDKYHPATQDSIRFIIDYLY